ncbi:hypothetical protein Q3G72_006902 [Acer saccharum]|nr:hypothetical protein Q3G72_006902 [Acer saccharum]
MIFSRHASGTIGNLLRKVTSPYGSNLHHNENVTVGRFAFTTSEQSAGTTLSLDWRIGITAKDWESVAKKEKIEGVEFDLKRLGYVVQAIHDNLVYLKSSNDLNGVNVLPGSHKCLSVGPVITPLHLRHRWVLGPLAFSSISSSSNSPSKARKLVLYSKPGCCLCDGLKEKLQTAFLLSGSESLHDVEEMLPRLSLRLGVELIQKKISSALRE